MLTETKKKSKRWEKIEIIIEHVCKFGRARFQTFSMHSYTFINHGRTEPTKYAQEKRKTLSKLWLDNSLVVEKDTGDGPVPIRVGHTNAVLIVDAGIDTPVPQQQAHNIFMTV